MYLVLDVLFSGADMKFGELNPRRFFVSPRRIAAPEVTFYVCHCVPAASNMCSNLVVAQRSATLRPYFFLAIAWDLGGSI